MFIANENFFKKITIIAIIRMGISICISISLILVLEFFISFFSVCVFLLII